MRILQLQAINGVLVAPDTTLSLLFDNGTYVTVATVAAPTQPLPDRGRYTQQGDVFTFFPEAGGSFSGVINDAVAIVTAAGQVYTSTPISVS